MKRVLTLTALVAVVFSLGAVAQAASPWRVFGTATDRGEYATFANVSSKVVLPKALALRTSGRVDDVSWMIICSGKTKAKQGPGLSPIEVRFADTCDVSATVIGKSGTIRAELLRK